MYAQKMAWISQLLSSHISSQYFILFLCPYLKRCFILNMYFSIIALWSDKCEKLRHQTVGKQDAVVLVTDFLWEFH